MEPDEMTGNLFSLVIARVPFLPRETVVNRMGRLMNYQIKDPQTTQITNDFVRVGEQLHERDFLD